MTIRALAPRSRLLAPAFVALALGQSACTSPRRPPPAPVTLRAVYGLGPPARIEAKKSALVLVDYQETFVGGRLALPDAAAAIGATGRLLAWARAHGVAVVHVQNVASRADATLFAPGDPSTALVPALAPAAGEEVVVKHQGGAFSKTTLDGWLRDHGIDTLVVAGFMTHLAVETTARDATVLGYRVLVASDACATRALASPRGRIFDAHTMHDAALASLAERFADVLDVDAVTALPVDAR